jgi:hypothetical protein
MLDKPVLYPRYYRWVILFASLDVILTWIILTRGGAELNIIAKQVIDSAGLPGMLAYKFFLIILVLVICEHIGRIRFHTGRGVALTAIALNIFPVLVGGTQLARHAMH